MLSRLLGAMLPVMDRYVADVTAATLFCLRELIDAVA